MKNLYSTSSFAVLILSLSLAGCASTQPNGVDPAQAVRPAAAASKEVLKTLEILAVDSAYQPNAVTVARSGRYAVKLVNAGTMPHDITFPDGTKISASAGTVAVGEVEVPEDGIGFICSVPGHSQSGMKGEIMVAGNRTKKNNADDHGGPAATTVAPDPKAPNYRLYDATVPKAFPGKAGDFTYVREDIATMVQAAQGRLVKVSLEKVHDIELVVQEKMMTVAKGFVQNVWTYNGAVPGPVIRVRVGDTIRVHLKNPATNKLGHSVDFHASQTAWNDQMTTINPGEEKLYEWHADYAGVWMYHCGSNPALHHIANGLYGMVIVEPKNGLGSVDHEFALVQSEWYLGPQRQPTDLVKAAAAAPAPDFVVFNGVANQYKDHPLEVDTGKKVRLFVLNAGPNVGSSFHIVGTIFNTVIKEGINLTSKNPGHYGAQAVDLAPAQGAIIEFTTAEDGLYPIVTHAFNFVGRGALGLVKAGDGDPKGTGVAAK